MAESRSIPELMEDLQDILEQQHDLEDVLKERHSDIYERGEAIQREIQALRDELEHLEVQLREREPQIVSDLSDARYQAQRVEKELKDACHNLDHRSLDKTQSFEEGRIRVRVSKASFRVQYKTEALLQAHPELEDMFVDGDPVVGRTINDAVLDRLIARGDLDEKEMEQFREVLKIKNPSVRIEEIADGPST